MEPGWFVAGWVGGWVGGAFWWFFWGVCVFFGGGRGGRARGRGPLFPHLPRLRDDAPTRPLSLSLFLLLLLPSSSSLPLSPPLSLEHLTVRPDQQVVRLDVAVQHPRRVAKGQRAQQRARIRLDVARGEDDALGSDDGLEVRVDELEDEAEAALVQEGAQQGDDVRVRPELAQQLDLAERRHVDALAPALGARAARARVDALDRDGGPGGPVDGLEDGAKGAAPEDDAALVALHFCRGSVAGGYFFFVRQARSVAGGTTSGHARRSPPRDGGGARARARWTGVCAPPRARARPPARARVASDEARAPARSKPRRLPRRSPALVLRRGCVGVCLGKRSRLLGWRARSAVSLRRVVRSTRRMRMVCV